MKVLMMKKREKITFEKLKMETKSGTVINQNDILFRRHDKKWTEKKFIEKRLLLYAPCRNTKDLEGECATYEEQYNKNTN